MELGTGPKPVVIKKDPEGSRKSKTKKGQHLQCREMKQKKLSKSSKISQRNRARARVVSSNNSKRRKSSSEDNVSIVEDIISSTARTARDCKEWKKCDRNSALQETSYLGPFAHIDG